MATLVLIRHGQASYGEADYDRLSERGRAQAGALGPALAAMTLDAWFHGPLRRQRETAELARAATPALPAPGVLDELAEYPAFEMLQHLIPRLVAEDPKFAQLTSAPTPRLLDEAFHTVLARWGRDDWQVDGVERVGAFVDRVRRGFERAIAACGRGGRVAVVTSAGPIGVAVGLVFALPPERAVRTSVVVRNASISELKLRTAGFAWQPEQVSLLTFNGTAHLPPELVTER
nr:histidine phosphatase family protein [Kofleriaceae bacterium]